MCREREAEEEEEEHSYPVFRTYLEKKNNTLQL